MVIMKWRPCPDPETKDPDNQTTMTEAWQPHMHGREQDTRHTPQHDSTSSPKDKPPVDRAWSASHRATGRRIAQSASRPRTRKRNNGPRAERIALKKAERRIAHAAYHVDRKRADRAQGASRQ